MIFGLGNPVRDAFGSQIDDLAAEFEDLKSSESERLERYRTYREELEAARESIHGPDVRDYGRRKKLVEELARHRIVLPFGQALTVKHTYRVAGRLPDVMVDRRDESGLERYRSSTMEKMIWGVISASRGQQQFTSASWDASQVGSGCFDIYWDPKIGIPRFRAFDPAGFLVVRGVEDPHEFQRVYRFWQAPVRSVQSEYREYELQEGHNFVDRIEPTHKSGTEPMVTLVDACDTERCVRFALGSNVPLWIEEHGYGFVPYVVIPNLGPERHVFGWADYEFYRDLCAYIPQMFSREADVLRMTAGGAYQDFGTGQKPEAILNAIRTGGVVPVKRDSDGIKPIPGPEEPAFLPDHMGQSLEYLKMLGFAPDAAWGSGNAGSGADRGLQLGPLVELTALKQVNWASGLQRLFERVFKMIELRDPDGGAMYRGTQFAGDSRQTTRFAFVLNQQQDLLALGDEAFEEFDPEELAELPTTPQELFDGDYTANFFWHNRIDPDDPAYVTTEVNKFAQTIQSLETTLERLGIKNPEEEIRRIEKEAERMPWLREGSRAFTEMALGVKGGEETRGGRSAGAAQEDALGMFGTEDGDALATDAGIESFEGVGVPYGGA